MSETSPEMRGKISQEKVVNVLMLSREIKPLIDNESDTSREQTRVFLKKIYPEANYDDFGDILDLRNANIGDKAKAKITEISEMVGAAFLIASGDKAYDWSREGSIGTHMAEGMERISEVVNDNIFVRDENDEVGKEIVKNLREVEKINNRAAKAPNAYEKKRVEETENTISILLDRLDEVESDSEDAIKLSDVIGWLDSQLNDKIKNSNELTGRINMEFGKNTEVNKKQNKSTKNSVMGKSGLDEESLEKQHTLSIEAINILLDQIENSGHASNDLTYNSNRSRILDEVSTGIKRIIDAKGNIVENKEIIDNIKESIFMRKYLNDLYLEMSKVHDIQSAIKVLQNFHEGDTSHTLDQRLISFYLRDKSGLPVAKAWNLRQDAYFKYFDTDRNITTNKNNPDRHKDKVGMLVDIVNKMPHLLAEGGFVDDEYGNTAIDQFYDVGIAFHKENKENQYGINKDYYLNLRCESDTRRANVVERYMIQSLMETEKCSLEDAKKAVELAKRLSVVTMQDSAANIGLADGDSYAELILLKFFRYQDTADTGGKNPPKDKRGTGSSRTIKYLESLTPPWLGTVPQKEWSVVEGKYKARKREVWAPMYANDIDPTQISGKSDMLFHFSSIVDKQIGQFVDLITKPSSPKTAAIEIMENVYSRINKTVSVAEAVGWPVLAKKENNLDGNESLEVIQRMVRARIVSGIVHTAAREGTEWNQYSFYKFMKWVTTPQFLDSHGKETISFITPEQSSWIKKAYRTHRILAWTQVEERLSQMKLFGK